MRVVLIGILILVFASDCLGQQRDLRAQFGTQNFEAAKAIEEGIQASSAGKKKEALEALKRAVKFDPKCGMAHFQLALAHSDIGEIDESLAAYKKVLSHDVVTGQNIRSTAATNMGLTYGKLEQYDDACVWLSRGILEDYDNKCQARGKAYRNLALSLKHQKKPLAAAIAVAMAFEDKAPNCDMNMVRGYFKEIGNVESAKVLYLDEKSATVKPREQAPELTEVEIDVNIGESVQQILVDPAAKYSIVIPNNSQHYYLLKPGAKFSVTKVESDLSHGANLVEGHLYVARTSPDRIEKCDPLTGKMLEKYELKKPAPFTFAVMPARKRIFFPNDDVVWQYDMRTRVLTETNTPGHVVCGSPDQRYVYSYTKPERQGGGFIVVGGRIIDVQRRFDWIQTTLFKSVLTPSSILLAEVRDNAASNGQNLIVSADGKWATVVGGGGYRPLEVKGVGGYGVAIFEAGNLENMQGFFPTELHPKNIAINPITQTVIAQSSTDFFVSHLSNPKNPKKYSGKWSGVSTWSGDGRYFLIGKESGLAIYKLQLTKEEEKFAETNPTTFSPKPLVGEYKGAIATGEPIEWLTKFEIPTKLDADGVKEKVQRAIEKGRMTPPVHWLTHAPYKNHEAAINDTLYGMKILKQAEKDSLGVALYKLKKADEKTPNFPPLKFVLAEIRSRSHLPQDAEKDWLASIHQDAGRTDITLMALEGLARHHLGEGRKLHAAYCRSVALEVDRANPIVVTRAIESLKAAKMDSEAATVSKLSVASSVQSPESPAVKLPSLPAPVKAAKMNGEELYAKTATSVVVITTRSGSGSGVCVARGDIIVTNAHVVGDAEEVEVRTFGWDDKKLVRKKSLQGKVVHRSVSVDLAIVQLPEESTLIPLDVAETSPKTGANVFALGSPGLGDDILEQSISAGLVSATERKVDGHVYLQHSSAVNPGNSGGPLLDETSKVVGIVTLKAKLENVSFAVPVEQVRKMFPEADKNK